MTKEELELIKQAVNELSQDDINMHSIKGVIRHFESEIEKAEKQQETILPEPDPTAPVPPIFEHLERISKS